MDATNSADINATEKHSTAALDRDLAAHADAQAHQQHSARHCRDPERHRPHADIVLEHAERGKKNGKYSCRFPMVPSLLHHKHKDQT